MGDLITSLVPVFTVILAGYICRKSGFLDASFWQSCEKLTYFILLPSLFFMLTMKADFSADDLSDAPLILLLALSIVTAAMIALRTRISLSPPAFTSMYQGAIRFNSYVLLGVSTAITGHSGAAVTVLMIAILVPIINVACVAILIRYGENAHINLRLFVFRLITNPLIVSCVLGIMVNQSEMTLPKPISGTLDILGRAALPLGLLCVGAGVKLKELHAVKSQVIISNAVKLLILPLIVMALGAVLDVDRFLLYVCVIFAAMPGATSAYILARQMGGDTTLMANIVMSQTLLSIMSIPLVTLLFEWWFL